MAYKAQTENCSYTSESSSTFRTSVHPIRNWNSRPTSYYNDYTLQAYWRFPLLRIERTNIRSRTNTSLRLQKLLLHTKEALYYKTLLHTLCSQESYNHMYDIPSQSCSSLLRTRKRQYSHQ